MLRRLFRKKPLVVPDYKIIKVWIIERGTIRHKLAQESLILANNEKTPKDHDRFVDNGDHTLSTFYFDLLEAYKFEIRREEKKRIRILNE